MDRKQKKRKAPIIEALEPRVLFSADMFGGAADNPVADDSLATLLNDTAAVLEKQNAQLLKEKTDAALTEPLLAASNVTSPLADVSPRIELVFVDTDTPEYQQLIDDMLSTSDDSRRFEVILLDNDSDGIEQMTAAMEGFQGIDAIHVISHGEDGAVHLGNTQLNNQNLAGYQAQLQSWANYLDADADILFYGCDLAASADGEALIDQIATLTGADIAASDDLTGHADLGGDWELEYNVGQIEAQTALSEQVQVTWQGSLSQALWLSTDSNVTSSGANGLNSWTEGQVLEFSGASLAHGEATAGDLSLVIDFDAFTQDAVDAGALHFVSHDMTVGGANGTFDLKAGDVLVSFLQDETILAAHSSTGADMLVHDQDLLVFRPDAFNDYSAGTFTVLLNDVVADDLKGVTLIEQDTTIGGTDIAAGSFLLIAEVSGTTSIDLFVPTGVGLGTTTGTTSPLIDISQLGIEKDMLRGIEVIEAATTIGGQSLANGDILATLRNDAASVGSNGLSVTQNDVFVLSLTSTGMGTTAGTASMFLDGSDVGLDNSPSAESPYALALHNYSQLTVDTTSDVADGDTSSIEALLLDKGADGKISLREAIAAANATPNGDIADTIRFNITDPLVNGAHTIAVGSALPTITDTLAIDGTSEPDFSGTPVIRIDGAVAGANTDGLSFSATSDNSIVRGLMITGFTRDGVLVQAGADYLTFTGNWIGTSGAGSTGVGNGDDGIELRGSNATIGGVGPNEGNVITNSGDEGLQIMGTGVTAHLIQGNYIGLDPDGVSGSGNADVGIAIVSGSGNTIGGTTASARNVISNNFEGIEVNTSNNVFQGNYIGTDASGTLDRGNHSDDGIEIQSGATGNLIGGTETGAGNLIAFNARDGVNIVNGSGNTVLGNQIHSNSDLGIDLGTTGVTSNDTNDGDAGANNLQNYPIITSAELTNGSDLTVSGTLDASAASAQYRIEFFGNAAGTQDSTNGEGRFFLGGTFLTTDLNGDGTFNDVTLSGITLGEGDYVTATATRIDDSGQLGNDDQLAYGDTSEFAANVAITGGNVAPEITASAGATGYSEQETAVVIDPFVALVDPDGFDGADPSSQYMAEVQITGNYTVDDVLGFTNTAKIQGDLVGNVLTLSVISGQTATVAEFEAALQSVTFYNGSDTPSDLDRTISFSFNDGLDSSNVATKVVQVAAVNDNPIVTLPSSPAIYSVGGSPVIVDANATINDVDSVNFSGGDLRIGFMGVTNTANDVLAIRNQGTGIGEIGISGSSVTYSGVIIGTYSGGTGGALLTVGFNADATSEAVQALARNILYENLSSTPDTSDRQIRFELRDGDGGNNPDVFQTINFDNEAVISGDTSFSGNEGDLVSGTLTATDADGLTDGTYFTVSSQGSHGTAAIREGTGEWVFTPTDSDWSGTDQFTVTVTDDKGGTTEQVVSITLANVNDAPTDLVTTSISQSGISLNEDGNDTYLVADNGLPSPLSQFTLEVQFEGNSFSNEVPFISYNTASGDMLTINTMANNTLELDIGTGSVVFSNAIDYNATLMDGQRHTLSVSWDNAAGDWSIYIDGALIDSGTGLSAGQTIPTGGTLMFGLEQDSVGGNFESQEFFNGELYDIRLFDDVRTATEVATNYTETLPSNEPGMVANWIFDNLSSDGRIVESVSGNNLTVQHTSGTGFTPSNPELILSSPENSPNGTVVGTLSTIDPDSGDSFSYTLVDNAGGRFDIDSVSGDITVLDASLIDYETAASHDITVRVTDAGGLSYDEIFTIQVVNTNDAPVEASIEGSALAYTENDGAVAITSTLTISDVDDTNIESAVIQVTAGYNSREDVLSFMDQNGITGSFNATNGTWTLTGSATLGHYETAIRSITYSNSSENPDTTTRTVSFTVNDGDANSNTQTRDIDITAANDAPVLDSAALTLSEGQTVGVSAANFGITDPDDSAFTFTVSGVSGGYFQLSTNAGVAITSFTSADLSGGLVQFVDDGNEVAPAFSVTVNDGALDSNTLAATINYTGVNDAPEVTAIDLGNLNEDGSRTITQADLLAGSSDADGDALTAINLALSSGNGTLTNNNDGTWTFTPAADWNGAVSFGFEVSDGTTTTANTASMTVDAVNDAPVLDSAALTLSEGQTVGVSAANFGITDPDDSAFTFTVSGVSGGYFQLSTNAGVAITSFTSADLSGGLVQFVDDGNEVAPAFSVTVNDGALDSNTLAATINYTGVNDAPEVTAIDLGNLNEDGSRTITQADLLAGSSDADGDALTAINLALSSGNGTLTNNNDGTWTFTPAADWNGAVSFGFEVSDGTTTTANTASMTVDAVNDAPVLDSAALTLSEGQTVGVSAANFGITDPDDSAFTFTVSGVSGGYFQLSTNAGVAITSFTSADLSGGLVQFVDDGNEVAPAFSVTVNDGALDSNTLAATINYTGVNDAPEVTAIDLGNLNEDGSRTITQADLLAGSSDADGDALTAINLALSSGNGTLTNNNDGTWTFTPAADWNGAVSFGFEVSDGTTTTANTASMTVDAVNDAPVLDSAALTLSEGQTVGVSAANFGITDPDDSAFTFTVSGVSGGYFQLSTNAGVAITSFTSADLSSGLVQFVDDGNEVAPAFSVTVNDGALDSNTLAATINYTGVNDAPEVTAIDLGNLNEDGSRTITQADLLAGSSDADGDALTAINLALSSGNGTLTNNNDGTWTFTPAADWNGAVSFGFEVSDGTTTTANTASMTVDAVNDAPVLDSAALTLSEGQTVGVSAANFGITDPDDSAFTFTVSGVSGGYFQLSTNAGVAITSFTSADLSSGLVQFVDDGNEVAPAFSVTVNDGALDSNTLAATINYTGVNDAPEVTAIDLGNLNEDGSRTITQADLLAGSSDADGDALTAINLALSSGNGTLTNNNDGTWTFTPAADWNGAVSFGFEVSDGTTTTANTASMTVDAVNDAPVLDSAALTLSEGQTVGVSAANFGITDPDDSAFTFTVSGVSGGYFQLSTNAGVAITSFTSADLSSGLVQFVDDGNEVAPAFSVTVNDGALDSNTLAATINYTGVNDAPEVTAIDLGNLNEDGSRTITQADLLAGSSDADGDALTAINLALSSGNGTLTNNNDGTWTFTPAADWNGAVSFGFEVSDGTTTTANTASMTVNAVNDLPTGSVTISGIAMLGETLTAANSLADADGMGPVTYTWKADGVEVGNGTTYTLTESEVGRVITVEASYEDHDGGSELVTSAASVVARGPLPPLSPQPVSEYELEPEAESEPEPEADLETASEAEPNFAREPEVEQTEEAVTTGAEQLAPIDDEILAQVLATEPAVRDSYQSEAKSYNPVPPKFIDLLNLDLAPFDPDSNEIGDLARLMDNASFSDGLNEMKRDLDEAAAATANQEKMRAEVLLGATAGLSVGVISWVLRAGSLIAGFMSIAPLWRQIDPIPVLGEEDQEKDAQHAESEAENKVEQIFSREDSSR